MYIGTELNDDIEINKIYTVHYFEYSPKFVFDGERHDFWEFIYVDSGSVKICMDDIDDIILNKGDIAFHQPNEWHKVESALNTSPELIIISFECNSRAVEFFKKKILRIDRKERDYLSSILIEAKHLFNCPLNDPYTTKMSLKNNCIIGSKQILKHSLEDFLIHLIRRYEAPISEEKIHKINSSSIILKNVISYLEENVYSKLTIEEICRDNLINRLQLQELFKAEMGTTVIDYFIKIKINEAKRLIRSGDMNFNEIADKLGYSSIHYFSRQFKRVTAITPTDYALSIKALSEKKMQE